MDAGGGFNDATSAMGAYISRAADGSFLSIMDRAQWGYALFDAGCWGYASVTISTLAPLLFVRRIPSDPVQRWQQGVWEASKQGIQDEERAVEGFMMREADSVGRLQSGSIWPRYAGRGRADVLQGHMLEEQDEFRPLEMHIENATGTWVMMVAVSTLLAGIMCPIIGTIADRYSARKAVTYATAGLSVVFMTIFAFSSHENGWQELLAVVGLGMMFTSIMHCFYNSLLMMVSGRHDMVKVSCLQCCVGAWGSAVLMLCLGMGSIESEDDLDRAYVLYCFVFSAIWFAVLSVPMWFWLHEPETKSDASFEETFSQSWGDTLKSLQNVELLKFLLSVMLFNDANSTLHAVYVVYGAQIGLPIHALLLGAVFNRIVGGVAALAWLGVAQLADARLCFIGCILTTIVSIASCAWMTTVTDFYVVVVTMTTASSGSFIFAKVLMAMLTPKNKASHNFGFMGMINRVAGFVGPFLFSTLSFLYNERIGFMGLILMALCSLIVITTVDFEKGFAFSESHGGVLPLSPKTAAAALKDQDAANTQNAQKGTDSAVTSGHQGS